jgi:hypothetical protein
MNGQSKIGRGEMKLGNVINWIDDKFREPILMSIYCDP